MWFQRFNAEGGGAASPAQTEPIKTPTPPVCFFHSWKPRGCESYDRHTYYGSSLASWRGAHRKAHGGGGGGALSCTPSSLLPFHDHGLDASAYTTEAEGKAEAEALAADAKAKAEAEAKAKAATVAAVEVSSRRQRRRQQLPQRRRRRRRRLRQGFGGCQGCCRGQG